MKHDPGEPELSALSTGDLVVEPPVAVPAPPTPPGLGYELTPTPGVADAGDDSLLEVAIGPHHPSTHGVFRLNAVLDG